jgi:cell wall-associated NlpC family hydrolase
MRRPPIATRRLAVALCAVGLLACAPAVRAQDAPSPSPSLTESATATVKGAAASAWHTAQSVSSFALGLIGVSYKFGGNTPESGLDCSGLVRYVFGQVTGVDLPRTAREMSRVGDKISVDQLKPGDLVFFNTRRFAFSHVGIYLGDNQFIHAPRNGRDVEITMIDKSYWQKRFNGARRLVGVVPGIMPNIIGEAVAAPIEPPAAADEALP